ncbi:MAG: magnesium transporter [Clostridia bacterium]
MSVLENEDAKILIECLKKVDEENSIDIEHFNELVFNMPADSLIEIIDSIYAIDIAIALDNFEDEQLLRFYKIIDDEHMAKILEQANERLQRRIVEIFQKDEVLSIFRFMSNDDIADVLGNLRTDTRKSLLKLMSGAGDEKIQKLLKYAKDSAGGIMTTEYISLRQSLKVSDALQKIKKIGPKTEVIETIFIINDEKKLVGTVDLRDIFTASDDVVIGDIIDDNIVSVTPDVDQEEVSKLVSKYDLKAIAVVTKKDSLLGIITVDDIIDVLVEEQTEDILKLGGVSGEEGVYSSVIESVKVRLPWLLINLVTASLSAVIISKFESVIVQVVALSAIMPIVAATSGNSGSQTLSIIIRSITLGEINLKEDWKRIFKEVRVGMLNSLVTGSIASVVVYLMYNNIYLSAIIFSAMILNSVVASSCGFFIPLTLKALKLDPALASGIFLTAITDMMAFLIFLGLASTFLEQLI